MIHFTIFGVPVSIHWLFWVTSAMLSGRLDSLGEPGALWSLGIWMAVVFLSVLWHELGHVWLQKKFGAQPQIMLVAFGGLAIPHGARFTRWQSFLVAAAGPLFGLALGGACYAFFQWFPPETLIQKDLKRTLWFVNIGWSVLNLLPILPLDGGHMLQSALGPRRLRATAAIGMVLAALVAAVSFFTFGMFTVFLFGLLAWQNYQVFKQGHGSPGF